MASNSNQQTAQQQNSLARSLILANAVDRFQNIFSSTVDPSSSNVVNIAPRNVGLIKGFWVELEATVSNDGSSGDISLTELGPANLLSQIVFTDLQNNTRIQTPGWHLSLVNTARAFGPFGAARTNSSYPMGFGQNFDMMTAPSTIATSSTGTAKWTYYVPLAYSQKDLRGAVYANVVNATMNLQLTVNGSPVVASGDSTLAVYSGAAGSISSVKVNVYQHYLDQLPVANGQPILPFIDLSTIYELKNTSFSGMTANQDFPVPYANFRSFLSTTAIFDNAGTLNAGTDINYWALQSANYTQIFKMPPVTASMMTRMKLGDDLPKGCYYFDHRQKPINTIQYGNMELILNASSVTSGATALVGFEDFAMVNYVSGAGSLPAGG